MSKVEKKDAIIIFADIRGFTKWSENIEVFQHSPEFVEKFYKSLKSNFQDYFFKSLGDGALLIKTMEKIDLDIINSELAALLCSIKQVESEFDNCCEDFSKMWGQATDLSLGWGVTRGTVNEISIENSFDYIGSNINKASRLCDIARPCGIVVDAEDFSDIEKDGTFKFTKQQRRIKSLTDTISVWVTSEIAEQFHTRENLKETPEVHVAGICYKRENDKIKVLLAYRNKDRKLYPDKIEGCGGQLQYSETFEQGVARHFRMEMGITVKVEPNVYALYSIQLPKQPVIPGVVFLCEHAEGEPSSSNHSKIEWVDIDKINGMNDELFIPNIKSEIFNLLRKSGLY